MTHNPTIYESIQQFRYNKEGLEKREEDDLSDEQIDAIYLEISKEAQKFKPLI
jgi:uncharacterized metal-binding protein